MRPTIHAPILALALLASTATAAAALTLDGKLDAEYGPPLSLQTTQVGGPDATSGRIGPTDGGELDAAHAFISDGKLHLFVAGNLLCAGNPSEYGLFTTGLVVFIDTGAGGQNVLAGITDPEFSRLNGLTFDAGFAPGFQFACRGNLADYYDNSSAYTLAAWSMALPPGGGGTSMYLGATGAGGPGTLEGGANPGVGLAIDNSNVGGVTSGCGPGSPGSVTTGIEWEIPLAMLGNPTGCLRVSVVLTAWFSVLTNQALGPRPAGACPTNAPASTNFASEAGDQFFEVCPGSVPVRHASWGSFKSVYR